MNTHPSPSHLLDTQPAMVRQAAEREFQSLRRDIGGYRFTGRSNTYRWRFHDANTFHFEKIAPSAILDVGAGRGGVIEQLHTWGHDAYGVTAYTYGSTNPQLIEGDANHISQLEPLQGKRFSAVLSRWTLRHLTDPLCCLEQMTNMTAEDGELIIDEFSVNAISYRTTSLGRHVVDCLFDSGFVPATRSSERWIASLYNQDPLYPNIPSLHLRRANDAVVELPVSYDITSPRSWAYKIT